MYTLPDKARQFRFAYTKTLMTLDHRADLPLTKLHLPDSES